MMLVVENLTHRYAAETVLEIPEWHVDRGDAWLIAGPSGSGKTTLLAILAGLIRPARGKVTIGGQDISAMSEAALDAWRGRTVGYVPQRLHLIDSLNVLDNLLLAQYLAGKRVDRAHAETLLRALALQDFAHRYPNELSQGQAQRVAVARAVVNRPSLLLADEPTAALDDVHAGAAIALLTEHAKSAGATLAIASHDARVRATFKHILSLGSGARA